MVLDVHGQLCSKTQATKYFTLQLDEPTGVESYMRYIYDENEEDILFCLPLEKYSTTNIIFCLINEHFVIDNVDWKKYIEVVLTDHLQCVV